MIKIPLGRDSIGPQDWHPLKKEKKEGEIVPLKGKVVPPEKKARDERVQKVSTESIKVPFATTKRTALYTHRTLDIFRNFEHKFLDAIQNAFSFLKPKPVNQPPRNFMSYAQRKDAQYQYALEEGTFQIGEVKEKLKHQKPQVIPIRSMVPDTINNSANQYVKSEDVNLHEVPFQLDKDVHRKLVSLNGKIYSNVADLITDMKKEGLDEDTQKRIEHLAVQDLCNTIFHVLRADLPGLAVVMNKDKPANIDIDTTTLPPVMKATAVFDIFDPEDMTQPFKKIRGELLITDINNEVPGQVDAVVKLHSPY